MALIKVIIKEFIGLSSQFCLFHHTLVYFFIIMTYLEETKVEAKSFLMKLISVMEGQMVGRELMERKVDHTPRSNPDGNPLRG